MAVRQQTKIVALRIPTDRQYQKLNLTNKKIPAVNIVAAWISAEKGVGPYIASGNHICKPIWAELPTAAISNIKFDSTTNELFK